MNSDYYKGGKTDIRGEANYKVSRETDIVPRRHNLVKVSSHGGKCERDVVKGTGTKANEFEYKIEPKSNIEKSANITVIKEESDRKYLPMEYQR